MSINNQNIYKEEIPWVAGSRISESLPKEGVSKVIIKFNAGTVGGGAYVANTALEDITLYVNGKPTVIYNGTSGIAGQISNGIATLRELYKQMHNNVPMTANLFVIELPDAIPKNVDVRITATMASLASMGVTTSFVGSSYDVMYEVNDLLPKQNVVPYMSWVEWNDAANTGNLIHYLPALPMLLRTLIIITFDGTTLADDTYDRLEISVPRKMAYFKGKLPQLKEFFQGKSGVPLATGFYFFSFPKGLKVPSDTLRLEFSAGTAGTAKKIHAFWVSY